MRSYSNLVVGFLLGLGTGLVWNRLRNRTGHQINENGIVLPPLDQSEYEKRLEYIDRRYHEAMGQYDKLIPWAAGGSLVVSLTFVASFARVARPWTKWILGGAWSALVGALLCSILSQYGSTRIQVWAKRHLKSRQNPPADAAAIEEWRRDTIEWERRSARYGNRTKLLNVWSGILLVAGLIALGLFAILAVPFGQAVPP